MPRIDRDNSTRGWIIRITHGGQGRGHTQPLRGVWLVGCVAWRGGIAGFIRCPRGPRHAIGAGQPSARAGVAWRLALLGAAVGTDVARGVATGRGADSQLVYYPW
jgi:hypothetical protein